MKQSRWKPVLLLFVKLALSAILIYLVVRSIDIEETWNLIKRLNPFWTLLAVLAFILSKVISAFRLNRFFRAIGTLLPERLNLKLYSLGMFYNVFLPGGISGDGYKIYWLKRHYDGKWPLLFSAVIWDRISGMVSLILLGYLTFLLIPAVAGSGGNEAPIPSYLSGPIDWLRTVLLFLHDQPWIVMFLIPLTLAGYFWVCGRFYPSFRHILLRTTLQSFAVQCCQLVAILCIALALGFDWRELVIYLVFLVSSVVAVLPLSIGGLGLREFVFLCGAFLYGLDASFAVAISAVFYLITVFVSLSGVVFVIAPPAVLR